MSPELLVPGYFACDLNSLACVIGYVLCVLIGLIGGAILWLIFDRTIDLSRLISEPNGDASMARFQFLVFTFVISLSLFLVTVAGKDGKTPAFPAEIPTGILTLLGISGSSYAVGKAIQFSDPAGVEDRPVTVTITPPTAALQYKQKKQFTAEVSRKPDAQVKWEIIAGPPAPNIARIDPDTGMFTAPDGPSMPPAPHATVKATLVDYPDVSDVAVVTFIDNRPSILTLTVPNPTMKFGSSQDLTAQSAPAVDTNVKWEIEPGVAGTNLGTIDSKGHYTAPPVPAQDAQKVSSVTVKASLVNYPEVSDIAVIKFA